MNDRRAVLALSGGVGGAKLAVGLLHILPPNALFIVANTGDDFEYLGLHVSPDIDTLLYALSGRDDRERGWGRRDETWHFMSALEEVVNTPSGAVRSIRGRQRPITRVRH